MSANLQNARRKLTATIAILLFACSPSAATAQPQQEEPQQGQEPEGGGDHIMIGVGAAYMPAHHGADEYRFQPLPAIDVKWNRDRKSVV